MKEKILEMLQTRASQLETDAELYHSEDPAFEYYQMIDKAKLVEVRTIIAEIVRMQ